MDREAVVLREDQLLAARRSRARTAWPSDPDLEAAGRARAARLLESPAEHVELRCAPAGVEDASRSASSPLITPRRAARTGVQPSRAAHAAGRAMRRPGGVRHREPARAGTVKATCAVAQRPLEARARDARTRRSHRSSGENRRAVDARRAAGVEVDLDGDVDRRLRAGARTPTGVPRGDATPRHPRPPRARRPSGLAASRWIEPRRVDPRRADSAKHPERKAAIFPA